MNMSKGYVRSATFSDAHIIAEDMRPADINEIKALSGKGPVEAIKVGLHLGPTEVACLPDDTPVAVFGTALGHHPDFGVIWLLASNQFYELQTQFLRECRYHIQRLGKGYKALYNYTDARNTVHHRWLKWCGFTIIKEHKNFGVEGRPFYEFVRLMEIEDNV